jgi:hypothetical protein
VRVVWVPYPELTIIDIYRGPTVTRLTAEPVREEPEVLPGFSVLVIEFFRGLR